MSAQFLCEQNCGGDCAHMRDRSGGWCGGRFLTEVTPTPSFARGDVFDVDCCRLRSACLAPSSTVSTLSVEVRLCRHLCRKERNSTTIAVSNWNFCCVNPIFESGGAISWMFRSRHTSYSWYFFSSGNPRILSKSLTFISFTFGAALVVHERCGRWDGGSTEADVWHLLQMIGSMNLIWYVCFV